MEKRLSYNDLLEAMCGKNVLGFSKCYIQLFQEEIEKDGTINRIDDLFIDKPIINMFVQPGSVLVDFIYKSSRDEDLNYQWEFMNGYYIASNSTNDETGVSPSLTVLIVPRDYDGEYYAIGQNPLMVVLTPSEPTNPDPKIIRAIFREDQFQFLHADPKDIDKEGILKEIDSESPMVEERDYEGSSLK